MLLQVVDLFKSYSQNVLFNRYSEQFESPRLCLAAPNGFGKSTLLDILAGLEPLQSGEVRVNAKRCSPEQLQKQVALASDKLLFPEFLSAQELLSLTEKYCQTHPVQPLVDALVFAPFLSTKVADLSSGNLKKLQLINAFMRDVSVLLLDEPTAALEQKSIPVLLELIANFKGQIILTSHEPQVFIQAGFSLKELTREEC